MRSRLVLSVLLVLCAVVVGACGGGGGSKSETQQKSDYKKQATAILQEAKTALEGVQTRLTGKSGPEAAKEIATARQEITSAADKLQKLKPPADVKPAHDKFVDALRAFGEDFKQVEQAARANDQSAVQAAGSQLRTDATALSTASNALEARLK